MFQVNYIVYYNITYKDYIFIDNVIFIYNIIPLYL